jgi:hypothetical protein
MVEDIVTITATAHSAMARVLMNDGVYIVLKCMVDIVQELKVIEEKDRRERGEPGPFICSLSHSHEELGHCHISLGLFNASRLF